MTKLRANGKGTADRLDGDWLRKVLSKYENQKTDSHVFGIVRAVNADGSFNVLLSNDGTLARCVNCCSAAVGDRVHVCIKANGLCVAVARVGGTVAGATILYQDAAGTSGTVSLSNDVADFAYIDIECSYPDGVMAVVERVYEPDGRTVDVGAHNVTSNGAGFSRVRYRISGKTMTASANYKATVADGSWEYGTNNLLCTRVVGYSGSSFAGGGGEQGTTSALGSAVLGSAILGSDS